jgi:glucokinase
MILAGDIGGTKCSLGLFEPRGSILHAVFKLRLATRDFTNCSDLIAAFLHHAGLELEKTHSETNTNLHFTAAAFGVAGVVANNQHYAENLPWLVDPASIRQNLNIDRVLLLNDLAATALSLDHLATHEFHTLNPGTPVPGATKAVIAAGTGLGTAILFFDGSEYRVAASEEGMADFAPRTDREFELLQYWRQRISHLRTEDFVAGRAFRRIHEFLNSSLVHDSFNSPDSNPAAEISDRALSGSCQTCSETLQFWSHLLAGVAGNFALHAMALGGMFIGGGIAAKILPRTSPEPFLRSFSGDGKLRPVLERVPISVVLNEDAPLWGAAYQALALSQ